MTSPKTVCIDVRMVNSSGIGTVMQALLAGLRTRTTPNISFSLLGDPATVPQGPWRVRPVSSPIYSLREQWEIPRAARLENADLLHATHYNMPLWMASRTVVTVYDLIHLKFPQFWPSKLARAYAHILFHHVVPRARRVITISESTKRDLVEMLGIPAERIVVTYPAVTHARFQNIEAGSEAAYKRLGLPLSYLLYVGNLKEFKNVPRLLEAYRLLRTRRKDIPDLVLAGKNSISGFEQVIEATPGVRWIGQFDADVLPRLYKGALAFLFPSLYEGFGLPPLEAMASGTPVLCSDRGALPEVVGDAALIVNPESIEEIAAGIERLVDDSALRKSLCVKGLRQSARFSWDTLVNQTLAVYEECLA